MKEVSREVILYTFNNPTNTDLYVFVRNSVQSYPLTNVHTVFEGDYEAFFQVSGDV